MSADRSGWDSRATTPRNSGEFLTRPTTSTSQDHTTTPYSQGPVLPWVNDDDTRWPSQVPPASLRTPPRPQPATGPPCTLIMGFTQQGDTVNRFHYWQDAAGRGGGMGLRQHADEAPTGWTFDGTQVRDTGYEPTHREMRGQLSDLFGATNDDLLGTMLRTFHNPFDLGEVFARHKDRFQSSTCQGADGRTYETHVGHADGTGLASARPETFARFPMRTVQPQALQMLGHSVFGPDLFTQLFAQPRMTAMPTGATTAEYGSAYPELRPIDYMPSRPAITAA